jgi:sulfite exporter TauE/SafE
MPDSGFLALFLVGLLGGTHCVGMCGGIVSAMSMGGGAGWGMHLAYNSGRILSYAAAGAIAGALGAASMGLEGQVPARMVLYFIANLMLVALGLPSGRAALAFTERAGQALWRHLQPLTRRFLPVRSMARLSPRHAVGLAALRVGLQRLGQRADGRFG